MALKLEFPPSTDPIDYLTSFASDFTEDDKMQSALLGMRDSLRQAELIRFEPLGMFACLTAEEEAASFLYYALLAKGYHIPDYGRLHRHGDKIKVLIVALTLYEHFFRGMPDQLASRIRIERVGDILCTTLRMNVRGFEIVVEHPLETIVSHGDGEGGRDAAVKRSVDDALARVTPKREALRRQIDQLQKRRNRCLYGHPTKKLRFQSEAEMDAFTTNCMSIIVLGFLVHFARGRILSLDELIRAVFDSLAIRC